jgi:hypothetical protein
MGSVLSSLFGGGADGIIDHEAIKNAGNPDAALACWSVSPEALTLFLSSLPLCSHTSTPTRRRVQHR